MKHKKLDCIRMRFARRAIFGHRVCVFEKSNKRGPFDPLLPRCLQSHFSFMVLPFKRASLLIALCSSWIRKKTAYFKRVLMDDSPNQTIYRILPITHLDWGKHPSRFHSCIVCLLDWGSSHLPFMHKNKYE